MSKACSTCGLQPGVPISSLECDQLTLAIAALIDTRERVSTKGEAGEFHARLAGAEALLNRIIIDAMMLSPVVQEAMRKAESKR